MPNRISTGQIAKQQAKGVATGFASDVASTLIGNLFRRKKPEANILARRDQQIRLATLARPLFLENLLPPSEVIKRSPGNPYGDVDLDPETILKVGGTQTSVTEDLRVRLDLGTNNRSFFSTDIMSPLAGTKGVVFPYTPQLAVTHAANYIATPITHANFQHHTYTNSDIASIQITGDFTAQNNDEGLYLLATIHFFRTVTKMYFGKDVSAAGGTPPPILFLSAHGPTLFRRVPVVVTSFVSTFPADVDYMYVKSPNLGTNRIPTVMSLTVAVQPVFNRRQSSNFSLDDFAKGKLLEKGYI